jgi:hypothetical protein
MISFFLVALGELPALAYDKHECVQASDAGQALRIDGKLLEARSKLLVCGDPSCPQIVRAACADWLAELDKQIPTVTLSARDATGNDVLGVEVTVDGKALEHAMDGRAVPVDPGQHVFRFVAPDGSAAEQIAIVREGEQRRRIEVAWPARPRPAPPVPLRSAETTPTPWAAWGTAIGAGVAWATFGFFALSGHLQYQDVKSECAPHCESSRYDPINTKFVVADVALGVAVVASGVATILFLSGASAGGSGRTPPSAR